MPFSTGGLAKKNTGNVPTTESESADARVIAAPDVQENRKKRRLARYQCRKAAGGLRLIVSLPKDREGLGKEERGCGYGREWHDIHSFVNGRERE